MKFFCSVLTAVVCLIGFTGRADDEHIETKTKVVFGSCADDDIANPLIWESIIESDPSTLILMGDNVYLDKGAVRSAIATDSVDELKHDYNRLAENPGFKKLQESTTIHATWDDHDFGLNDGGREFEGKHLTKKQFLNFFQIDPESERFVSPGVYGSGWIESQHGRVQILLLDTRFFRSALKSEETNESCPHRNYVPTDDPHATMLGDDQWQWLEDRLQEPAWFHILVSSIQVIPEEQCFERWATMPTQRTRLLESIARASAKTVVLSGDRHIAEISMLPADDPQGVGYDLYEVTSSPLTASFGFGEGEPNRFRVVGDNVRVNNFGFMEINWAESKLSVELRDQHGETLRSLVIQNDRD